MKKSFILYTEWKETVESLTDKQAGKLLKAFFDFNSGNEIALDPVLKLVFIPIKQQFLRDFEKWERIRDRNKENIKKRWEKEVPEDTKNTTGITGIPNPLVDVDVDVDVDKSPSSKEKDFDINEAFRIAQEEANK